MSELRFHPFLQEWVITATHRQDRTFLPPADYCPLCPTKEGGFPTEVPASTYDIVVFENKFPSLQMNPPLAAVTGTPLTPCERAQGVCEVMVYSPDHNLNLVSMSLERVENILAVWEHRYVTLGAKKEIEYVLIFENKGQEIGVTLHHPHGQIYGFPFIPPIIKKELSASLTYYEEQGQCLFCDTLKEEYQDGRRIVLEGEEFVAFVPFFARYPYEVYLAPKKHVTGLDGLNASQKKELARMLKGLLLKYDALFSMPFPYIMVIHQAPTNNKEYPHYHLHFEFYPPLRTKQKMKYLAGCEQGAGTFINDTLAEEKAAELRLVGPKTLGEVPEGL